jgi:hypothetical protein
MDSASTEPGLTGALRGARVDSENVSANARTCTGDMSELASAASETLSENTGDMTGVVLTVSVSPPTANVSAEAPRTVAGTNVCKFAAEAVVVVGMPVNGEYPASVVIPPVLSDSASARNGVV